MMIIDTYPFINGKAVVWVKDSVFTEDNSPVVAKCGLINNIDEFIIPPIYDNIQYIGTDTVAVNIGFKEGKKYQYSGRWGIVDLNNQILVPLKYTDMIEMTIIVLSLFAGYKMFGDDNDKFFMC